jgi:hypothetical protein
MKLAAVVLLVAVLALVSLQLVPASIVTLDCKVCEDVVQTYHDRYRCAGEYRKYEFKFGPKQCDGPHHFCTAPDNFDQREECAAVALELRKPGETILLWETMRKFGKRYRTCTALNMCESDSEEGPTDCHRAFQDPMSDPKKVCSARCHQCMKQLYEFPLFQEICKPEGVKIEDEIVKPPQAEVPGFSDNYSSGRGSGDGSAAASLIQESQDAYLASRLETLKRTALKLKRERAHMKAKGLTSSPAAASLLQELQSMSYEGGNSKRELPQAFQREVRRHTTLVSMPPMPGSTNFLEKESKIYLRPRQQSRATGMLDNLMEAFTEEDSSSTSSPNAGEGGEGEEGVHVKIERPGDKCFQMWKELRKSRQARFYMSYKRKLVNDMNVMDVLESNGWDAHTTCKCLGKCALEKGESLDLVNVCRYTTQDDIKMKTIFPFLK